MFTPIFAITSEVIESLELLFTPEEYFSVNRYPHVTIELNMYSIVELVSIRVPLTNFCPKILILILKMGCIFILSRVNLSNVKVPTLFNFVLHVVRFGHSLG